ncbi:MAG: hypothetical protein LBB77_02790 [Treponema sp.]|jgi:hypothetical protein|nr:hypothetical protein [Treponema sp.]
MSRVAGIPKWILRRAAGFVQRRAKRSRSEWGRWYNWFFISPYGDDPRDQIQINSGFDYYDDWKKSEENKMRCFSIFCSCLCLFFISCVAIDRYTIKKMMPSPNSENIAVIFLGERNTLSSYSPKVSIYRQNEKIM